MIATLMRLTPNERKVIFFSTLGGALEFYDFIIYVFFADILSQLFFPASDNLVSLMKAFAVFAIGYLLRPLGGIIFSHFGDKYGRKKTFIATLSLMAIPTFGMGILPTYASIGIAAPLLLILLRILQGLAVGGEIPGAITFAGEHVNPLYRGLVCAIIFFGINIGVTLGSTIQFILFKNLSHAELLSWGWRVPFILGGLLGLLSYYLRRKMSETPVFASFQQQIKKSDVPIIKVIRSYPIRVLQGIMLASLGAVIISLLFLYMPIYLIDILHYPKEIISELNTINLLVFSSILIFTGWLSDIFGRRVILLIGATGFIVFGYVLFFILTKGSILYVAGVMLVFSIFSACISGVFPCTLIELFPTSIRYTGMATSYNIAFAIFGGMAPFVATYLIQATGQLTSPSFYLIGSALLCFIAAVNLKSKNKHPLSSI